MIIEKKKDGEVFIPPQVKQREYTMKVTPEAFSATIDNLYTDTIYSPVREYMANAVDAHLSIGSTADIEVHIPTELELWFEVKDFGPGLSEEDIEEYFIKLFSSKKQNTNDQIGFFGLGCKAAFTYASQMTVTSRQNGYFKEYNIIRQGREIPIMIDGRSGETNEPDGLTIRYDVRSRDAAAFYQAVNWASIAFHEMDMGVKTNLPLSEVVERERFEELTVLKVEHPTTALEESFASRSGGSFIRMGSILYPLQSYVTMLSANRNLVFFLNVEIGDLEPSTSRETLVLQSEEKQLLIGTFSGLVERYGSNKAEEIHNSNLPFREKFRTLRELLNSRLINDYPYRMYSPRLSDFINPAADEFAGCEFKFLKKEERGKVYYTNKFGEDFFLLANLLANPTKVLYCVHDTLDEVPRGLFTRMMEAGHNPLTQGLTPIVVKSEEEIEKLAEIVDPRTTFHKFNSLKPKSEPGPKAIKQPRNVHGNIMLDDSLSDDPAEIYWVPKNSNAYNFYNANLTDTYSETLVRKICQLLDLSPETVLACSKTDAKKYKLLPENNIIVKMLALPLRERFDFFKILTTLGQAKHEAYRVVPEMPRASNLCDSTLDREMRDLAFLLIEEKYINNTEDNTEDNTGDSE